MDDMDLRERTKNLIFDIVDELVDDNDSVDVSVISNGDSTAIFVVKTSLDDTGKIIGKNGRTADAIRCILQSIAAKNRCRFVLDIVNQRKETPKRRRANGNR